MVRTWFGRSGLGTRSLRPMSCHRELPAPLPAAATTRCAAHWLVYSMAVAAVPLTSQVASSARRARRGCSRAPPCAGRYRRDAVQAHLQGCVLSSCCFGYCSARPQPHNPPTEPQLDIVRSYCIVTPCCCMRMAAHGHTSWLCLALTDVPPILRSSGHIPTLPCLVGLWPSHLCRGRFPRCDGGSAPLSLSLS